MLVVDHEITRKLEALAKDNSKSRPTHKHRKMDKGSKTRGKNSNKMMVY